MGILPKLLLVLAIISFAAIGLNYHTEDIKAKLEYQEKYPYSCAVGNAYWDRCAKAEGNYITFNSSSQECLRLYYFIGDWGNNHPRTYDSDGLVHYYAQGYDSNNVWHRSGGYIQCPQRGFA